MALLFNTYNKIKLQVAQELIKLQHWKQMFSGPPTFPKDPR